MLLREQRPINFKSVAETARVSTAWLYQHDDIKQRIAHLRGQQSPKPKTWIPPQTRASDASKDQVTRLKQEARIAELEAKLAVLEPYRTFVEQVRRDMQSKEHGGRWMMDDLGPGTYQN